MSAKVVAMAPVLLLQLCSLTAAKQNIAVCISGKSKTLFSKPVVSTYYSKLVKPLESDLNAKVLTFVVIANIKDADKERYAQRIQTAYGSNLEAMSVVTQKVDTSKMTCPIKASVQKYGKNSFLLEKSGVFSAKMAQTHMFEEMELNR